MASKRRTWSLQGGTEAAMIMVGLPFVPHTAVPHRPQSMSFESLQSSVEWIAATGFPLQMEKKKKKSFPVVVFFL